jgi:NadR type nicotinamide-nucleotide adenylyltransferase
MNDDFTRLVTPVKRVAIVGPECTGKTSLAQELASVFATEWVPEYARGYLDKLVLPYTEGDLLNIAQGQMRIEDEFYRDGNRVLICDTNLLVIKIWSEFVFKSCNPWIVAEMTHRQYDLHLLTNIDMPWEEDPQREHPTKRKELFDLYKRELDLLKVPFVEISGDRKARLVQATEAIKNVLSNG